MTSYAKQLSRSAAGLRPLGRPLSKPNDLFPALMDLAFDRRPFRRSLSGIATRLLKTTKYKNRKKLERRIAETLDWIGYLLKRRRPIADDPRSPRDRALDYLVKINSFQQTKKAPPKTP